MTRHYAYYDILLDLVRDIPEPRVAEVGVWAGLFSEWFLKHHAGLRLTMIDLWKRPALDHPYRTSGGDMVARKSQDAFDAAKAGAIRRTDFAAGRRLIYPCDSLEMAPRFIDGHFDLVFLDAEHYYEAVRDNLKAWWPKVKRGGVLAVHDYHSARFEGCTRAVDEWCPDRHQTADWHDGAQLFWVRKP